MNILVYGLGAVGTVFATFLKEAGHTVYGKTKEKYIPYLKDKTLQIQGIWGNHQAKLDGVVASIEELKGKSFDLIIITVKSYDTKTAIQDIKKIINDKTYILLAQNGYGNYETAKQYIPAEQILLARVIFGAKLLKPGIAEITVNADDVVIGQPENLGNEEEIKRLIDVIKNAGIPARFSSDVYQILWDKILYNSALNPLGAILECSYGELAKNPHTRETMNSIVREIFEVAKANGIKLRWDSPDKYLEHFYKKLIPPTEKHYPSMYYDIKEGKRTEIDALNGAIVRLAKQAGIDVPVNETITNLLKFKESKHLKK